MGAKRGRPSLSLCRRVDDLRRYWLNAPESDRHEAFAMLTTFVDEARAGVFVADEGSCFFPPPEDVDEFPPDSVSSSDDPHVSVQIGRTSTEPPSVGSVPEHEEADKTASSRDSATFAIWSKVVRRPAARSNADDVISSSPQLEEKQAVEQPPTQKTSNLSCISSNSYDPDDKGIPPQTVPESLVDDVPISDQTDHHDGDDMRPSTVQSIDSHDEHHPDDIPFTANQLVPMGI